MWILQAVGALWAGGTAVGHPPALPTVGTLGQHNQQRPRAPAGAGRPSAPGAAHCAPKGVAKPLGGYNLLQQLKLQLLKADRIPGHRHSAGAVRNSTMCGLVAFPKNTGSRQWPERGHGWQDREQQHGSRCLQRQSLGKCFWKLED